MGANHASLYIVKPNSGWRTVGRRLLFDIKTLLENTSDFLAPKKVAIYSETTEVTQEKKETKKQYHQDTLAHHLSGKKTQQQLKYLDNITNKAADSGTAKLFTRRVNICFSKISQ